MKPKVFKNIGIVRKEIIRLASWTNHQSDRDVNPLKSVALIQNSLYAFKKLLNINKNSKNLKLSI